MTRLINAKPAIPLALQNFDSLPDTAFVRVTVVSGLLGQCADTTWRRTKTDPQFPKPRKFGPKHTAWNVGELRRFLSGGTPA